MLQTSPVARKAKVKANLCPIVVVLKVEKAKPRGHLIGRDRMQMETVLRKSFAFAIISDLVHSSSANSSTCVRLFCRTTVFASANTKPGTIPGCDRKVARLD